MAGWRRALPVLAVTAAVVVLFHRLLLGEVIFWGTPLLQFAPWQGAAFDALRGGELPLWNPLLGSGAPLLANYQTAALYPPNWLHLLLPSEVAMGLVGALHLIWAGAGMAALLRRWGADALGQGVAGLAYALSGYLVGRFSFLSIVATVAWLPWLVWAVDGVLAPGGRLARRAGWLAGVVGMLLLAGHAQTAFYSLLLGGLYGTWRIWRAPDARRRALAAAPGALLLGAGLAAAQLLPTLELMLASQRSAGVDRAAALSYSFWPWHTLGFLAPRLFGSPASGDYRGYANYWESAVYVGVPTLLLAGRALLVWARSRRSGDTPAYLRPVPFLAGVIPPVFVLALGWHTPVYPWLFEHVPTFDLFNGPARWMLPVVFALSALGGLGAAGWRAERQAVPWAMRLAAAALGVGLAAGAAHFGLRGAIPAAFTASAARLALLLAFTAGLAIALRAAPPGSARRPPFELAVLALLAADLVAAGWGLNPTARPALYHESSELAGLLLPGTRALMLPADEDEAKFRHFFSFQDFQAADSAHWAVVRASLLPNLTMLDGVPAAHNFDPLLVGHHADLLSSLDALPPAALLDAAARLNVGLLLTLRDLPGADPLGMAGPVRAYAVPDPWPRASVAACEEEDGALTCEPASGRAQIVLDAAQRVTVRTTASETGWLLLLDTDYPGWRASVDGQPATIRRANGAFRAVSLPAGAHEVTFTYRPASVRIGLAVSAASVAAWLALIVWPRRPVEGRTS